MSVYGLDFARAQVRAEQLRQLDAVDPELFDQVIAWFERSPEHAAGVPLDSDFWKLLDALFVALDAADVDQMLLASLEFGRFLDE